MNTHDYPATSSLVCSRPRHHRLRRVGGLTLFAISLFAPAVVSQAHEGRESEPVEVKTMTVNLYVGGNTGPVLALDPSDPHYVTNLVTAVTGVYQEILASQPEVRLQKVAKEIAEKEPDVVAVQEASLIRVQSPGDLIVGGHTPATTVVVDFLKTLVEALEADGAHYAIASVSNEFDVELPMLNLTTGSVDDARLSDREAILVRLGGPCGKLDTSNPLSGNFSHVIQLPGLGLSVLRGWCSVDIRAKGETFRFICTHLEEETSPALQVLQAQELIDGPAKAAKRVILAGDFNADSLHRDGSIAYDTFTTAGFADAWLIAHPHKAKEGLTWGHDELLGDPDTLFDRRIDQFRFRGHGVEAKAAKVTDLKLSRSTPPLWASDHAALTATFLIGGSD